MTDTPMLERCARAVCKRAWHLPLEKAGKEDAELCWDLARIMIKAMMIPSHAVIEAGDDTFVPSYTGTPVSTPENVWQAMLKAILEGK